MKNVFYLSTFLSLAVVFSFALVSPVQAGTLEDVTVTPINSHGGALAPYTLTFKAPSGVEISSQVVIEFPSGFSVPSVMATTTLAAPSTSGAGINASSASKAAARSLTLYLGGDTITPVNETVQVQFGGIQSPHAGGLSFVLDVQTRTAAGDAIDSASSSAFRIFPAATSSSDQKTTTYIAPPSSSVTMPEEGEVIPSGVAYTIKGTAWDQGVYSVSKVEVSVDGGVTWLEAILAGGNWEYTWANPTEGEYRVRSRAVDTAGNVEDASFGFTVAVSSAVSPTSTPAPEVSGEAGTVAALQAQVTSLQQQVLGLLQQLVALLTAQLSTM